MSAGVITVPPQAARPMSEVVTLTAEPSWLLRLFCRHRAGFTLQAIGAAVIGDGTVLLPAVEVRCSRCGEFWHVELDASEAVSGGLGE